MSTVTCLILVSITRGEDLDIILTRILNPILVSHWKQGIHSPGSVALSGLQHAMNWCSRIPQDKVIDVNTDDLSHRRAILNKAAHKHHLKSF